MESGVQAWIANHRFDINRGTHKVELPGGWHWDISPDKTGYLKDPDGKLCVGYDLNTETIKFGANGETKAPGLNLWTIQEMGEKFARQNFMTDEAGKAYDEFAAERSNNRKAYEKNVRAQLTGAVKMELCSGRWIAHVDTAFVKDIADIDVEPEISREEGIALFNRLSEESFAMPLRDAMGYMTMDNNVYTYIKDQYDFQYNDMIDNIDAGYINGNGRGCQAVLDKLDSVVRKNIREFCLPESVNYQELRHVVLTPDIKVTVDEFVKQRVTKTVNFEKKRSHSPESLERDNKKFLAAGDALREQIELAVLPAMDVAMEDANGITIE